MQSSIIVTGGAGFIGSNLVKKLVHLGYNTIVVDNFSTGRMNNLRDIEGNDLCQIYEFDITKHFTNFLADLSKKYKNISGVFHLAAQVSVQKSIENPKEDAIQNFHPIYDLIEFLSLNTDIEFLTFASSAAVYGEQEHLPIKENAVCKPISPYALHKLNCEYALQAYSSQIRTQIRSLRFFNVYGPNQDPKSPYSGVVSKFLKAAKNYDKLAVFGTGKQTRDFIYVENVVDALILSMNRLGRKFDIVNIGNGLEISILHLAQLINQIVNQEENQSLSFLEFKEALSGDIFRSACNNEKLLFMMPKYVFTSLLEGLHKTYDWI